MVKSMRASAASDPTVRIVAPGVYFVETRLVNWTLLAGDGTITLIDAGYPRDLARIERVLRSIGGELTTILVTHGHTDHIGAIRGLLAERPTVDVLASSDELPNIRRDVKHQVGPRDLLPQLWRPSVVAWTARAIAAGGLADVGVPDVQSIDVARSHRFSGHDVVPLSTPGHTPGHLAYWLPERKVLVSGDAIVTGHPTSTRSGPHVLAQMFNFDHELAQISMREALEEPIEVILPGHGPLLELRRPSA